MWLIQFMKDGGVFMYPILIIAVLGIAIGIERLITLASVRKRNQALWQHLQPLLQRGDLAGAQHLAATTDSELSHVLRGGLDAAARGAPNSAIEGDFDEGLMETIPRLEARTGYLSTFANVATLLGLLGTVHGLIQAFASVATADPAQKGDLLSAALAVSMNTTAFGLGSAIPLILLYTYVQNNTGKVVDSLEAVTLKVLNGIRRTRGDDVSIAASEPLRAASHALHTALH